MNNQDSKVKSNGYYNNWDERKEEVAKKIYTDYN